MSISELSIAVKADFESALAVAECKLALIIEREGDANGQRRTQEYLMQLTIEEITRRAATAYCMAHYRGGRNGNYIKSPNNATEVEDNGG